MKVYALYSGCKYEGGGVKEIYKDKETAIKFALMEVEEEKKQTKRVHKQGAKNWEWKEVIRESFWDASIIKVWQNPVNEIAIYEYELK